MVVLLYELLTDRVGALRWMSPHFLKLQPDTRFASFSLKSFYNGVKQTVLYFRRAKYTSLYHRVTPC